MNLSESVLLHWVSRDSGTDFTLFKLRNDTETVDSQWLSAYYM